MRQFKVQALPLEGHKWYRRAGHAWPRGDGYQLIEVLSEKDKRKPGDVSDEGYLLVTEAAFDVLANDKFLKVIPDGDPLSLAEHAQEVKALRKRVVELEAIAAKTGAAKLEARVKQLEAENAALKAKIAEGRPA